MALTRDQVLGALRGWINQRPGLDFGLYGDVTAYRAESRSITKDREHALTLLRAVELRESINVEALRQGFRAFSGRLTLSEDDKGRAKLDYCAGQYFPTEYRRAACAVLASVLWDHVREHCMPKPEGKVKRVSGSGPFATESEHDAIQGMSPGDWLRQYFRKEFGRTIAKRWFS